MKKIILSIITFVILGIPSVAKGQQFFDTSDAPKFFTLGARLGFNTSNRTFPKGKYSNFIVTSWGTGFDAGVVANLNFKEYLTLQPGFFFESRSGNLVNIADYYIDNVIDPLFMTTYYALGHRRDYYFTIPVMGVVKFNLADKIKWNVELGPYFQILLKETGGQNNVILWDYIPAQVSYLAQHRSFDVGLKMGTGLQLYSHYYIGVHYQAGLCDAWKLPSGGKNKAWMFTLGYDF